MPPDRLNPAALVEMLQAAQSISRYLAGKLWNDYQQNDMLRHAVERNVEIIGEAARRLTQDYRASHPEIPWRPIMATRHILAHEYDEVDDAIVWRIATVHIPDLLVELIALIPPPPPDPEPEGQA